MNATKALLLVAAAAALFGTLEISSRAETIMPCRTAEGLPGVTKAGMCVENNTAQTAAPVTQPLKPRCIYGQAGCVYGRRDVEKILRERGEWPPISEDKR